VGLERGPLRLVSTIEELIEKKSSGSGLESREYFLWVTDGGKEVNYTHRSRFIPRNFILLLLVLISDRG
jgi:hypothetical protein